MQEKSVITRSGLGALTTISVVTAAHLFAAPAEFATQCQIIDGSEKLRR
jgi:hypothetical protein